MFYQSLSRFQGALIIAVLLGIGAAFLGGIAWVCVVILLFLLLNAVGVWVPRFQFYGPFYCRRKMGQRQVVLTFDDGPDPDSTPPVLDLLQQRGVKATFFCIGQMVERYPEVVKRIYAEGHLLGNHTWSHGHWTNFYSESRLLEEIQRTSSCLERITGCTTRFFRPPMGLSNPRVFRVAHQTGHVVVGWDARGFDTVRKNSRKIVNDIIRQVKPGSILLLHDGRIPADQVVFRVNLMLDRLLELDYEVVPLDSFLP